MVQRALVRGQPAVIAGPSKALKTSLSVDLALSIAAGGRFLGEFPVHRRARVAVVSGESGEHTLQETANRVCSERGVKLAALDGWLDWCFTLPTFSDLDTMGEFADGLAALKAEVVIIDPVYLALGAIDAKDLFEAGAAFRLVAEVLLQAGCTPVLVHHANRQLVVGEPMELQHLAYSGLEQFAQQFILLNRREPYRNDGTHDLWVRVGGSAGHGGLWSAHVAEGLVGEDFGGRRWGVSLSTTADVALRESAQLQAAKRNARLTAMQTEEAELLKAVDGEV